ncbi:hypothetical protein QR680_005767 [Steinernema hermaphroditum]|uniref:ZP domain-containing protein n=1 Tax=Steinernema hermaphroditum TaxID=289476 RepID=A0AA39HVG4_9BILA|nr:hypothetical protein QR680_005767 [Steinernema hermaphroditum]
MRFFAYSFVFLVATAPQCLSTASFDCKKLQTTFVIISHNVNATTDIQVHGYFGSFKEVRVATERLRDAKEDFCPFLRNLQRFKVCWEPPLQDEYGTYIEECDEKTKNGSFVQRFSLAPPMAGAVVVISFLAVAIFVVFMATIVVYCLKRRSKKKSKKRAKAVRLRRIASDSEMESSLIAY